MKTIKKVFFSVVLSLALAVNLGGTSANAMEGTEEQDDIYGIDVSEADDAVPYMSTVSFNYDATRNGQNLGKFTASSTTVHLTFSAPIVGRAEFRFLEGSSNGPIYKKITTPVAGTTSAVLTTTISVTQGTTYYIFVYPIDDFVQTRGYLQMRY